MQAADNRFVLADIAATLECSPVDLTGTPVPSTDRQAMAAQAGVYAIRHALIDVDVSELGGGPARPMPELEVELALVRDLRHDCDYAGAARLLPGLLRELHAWVGTPQKALALRLLCHATFLASSLLRALGRPAEAWLGAERSRTAAEAAEDPVLLGYVAFARASAALSCGSYLRGLALAERAVNDLEPHAGVPGGLEVAGTLHLVCGVASRGLKRYDDSTVWITKAIDIAGRTGETTTLGLFFGPTNVNLWRISMEDDGGEPGRAVEIAQATNPAVIGVNMREVFFHTDTARALARIRGRDREAIRHLLAAERMAPQHVHSSPLVQETARALLDRSQRQAGGAALRGLCERMRVAE